MARRRKNTERTPTGIWYAYRRVSTQGQAESGAGMAAQKSQIEAWAAYKGVEIKWRTEPGRSAKTLDREVLTATLNDLRDGKADGIVVAKLDRLSRSIADFARPIESAAEERWAIAAIDLGVDLSTPHGELIAGIMVLLAQWERRIISLRTKEGLAEKRAEGVRIGRPRELSDELLLRILRDIQANPDGAFSRIARELTAEQVPTARGKSTWYPATVRDAYISQDAQVLALNHGLL